MRNLRGSARMRGFHSRVNEKKNFERVDSLSLCLSLSLISLMSLTSLMCHFNILLNV